MTRKTRGLQGAVAKFTDASEDVGACWPWTGERYRDGYGRCRVAGKSIAAHRAAWIATYGAVADGLFVLHSCDNRICVNPAHLFLGDHLDNMKDMVAKGRQVVGDDHPLAKLREGDVAEIRAAYERGDVSQRQLARAYSIAPSLVHRIIHRQSWRSVS